VKQRARPKDRQQPGERTSVPEPATPGPDSTEPPAMAPLITNTGDDEDGAPTG
jgi:hypothetical protein